MKNNLYPFVLWCVVFLLGSCNGVDAVIERRPCEYDAEKFQHVLNYTFNGERESLCIEEEFDLAQGEVPEVEVLRRLGGYSFVLDTDKEWHYILNLNLDGTLTLHRID